MLQAYYSDFMVKWYIVQQGWLKNVSNHTTFAKIALLICFARTIYSQDITKHLNICLHIPFAVHRVQFVLLFVPAPFSLALCGTAQYDSGQVFSVLVLGFTSPSSSN